MELTLDCETIPWYEKEYIIDEKEKKRTPQEIEEDEKNPNYNKWDKYRYDPNLCEIVVIGVKAGERCRYISQHENGFSEKQVLEVFWSGISTILKRGDTILYVTFNGMSFDIPLLYRRSWIRGVMPTDNISMVRFRTNTNHIDIRCVMNHWNNYASGDVDTFLKVKFGNSHKEDICGADVERLWKKGEYKVVCDYCLDDVKEEDKLFQSIKGYYI